MSRQLRIQTLTLLTALMCLWCAPRAASAQSAHAGEPIERTVAQADEYFSQAIALAAESGQEQPSRTAFARAAAAYQHAADIADPPVLGLQRLAADAWLLSGETGHAVLAYRRALAADPWDAAARDGLRDARARVATQSPPLSLSGELRFDRDRVRLAFARAAAAIPAPIAIAISLLAWALAWVSIAHGGAKAIARTATLVPLVALAALPYAAHRLAQPPRGTAVVLVESPAHLGPSDAVYEQAFSAPLAPGTEVIITGAAREGWTPVETADARPCWIPDTSYERVVATDASPAAGENDP